LNKNKRGEERGREGRRERERETPPDPMNHVKISPGPDPPICPLRAGT